MNPIVAVLAFIFRVLCRLIGRDVNLLVNLQVVLTVVGLGFLIGIEVNCTASDLKDRFYGIDFCST
jgi:hypothetical protein